MKTEGKCRCWAKPSGNTGCRVSKNGGPPWHYYWNPDDSNDFDSCFRHCPDCGDYLADDGWAYEMVRKDSVAEAKAKCKWWQENSLVFSHLHCRPEYLEGRDCSERDCIDCRAAYLATEPWNQVAAEESETDA